MTRLFILTVFLALTAVIIFSSCGNSTRQVYVTIKNQSGHNIKKLTLHHQNGLIENNFLRDQDQTLFIFQNSGENVYNVTATLDNDTILKSKGEYVEGGYHLTETITTEMIKTSYDKNY